MGLHGNMKEQQGYWKWVFGMWRVLKAKYDLKKAVTDIGCGSFVSSFCRCLTRNIKMWSNAEGFSRAR